MGEEISLNLNDTLNIQILIIKRLQSGNKMQATAISTRKLKSTHI